MTRPAQAVQSPGAEAPPRLRRVLSLWDLIFYGIVVIMPIAPVPIFGLTQELSSGHAVTTLLVGMLAMMLTAFSYGRMAAEYPSAGSAYTYVGRGLNLHLAFLAGWAMFLVYLIVPLVCTIYAALTVQRLVPQVPYALLVVFFAGTMTFLNLRGIRTTAKTNITLLAIMSLVIGVFIVLAIGYLLKNQGWDGLFSLEPFYHPATFTWRALGTGTSLAALTYIGFDGVTTLAEEVENPKRNVLLATVLVCLFTGLFGGLQIYLAQRVWPDYHTFPNLETAFMDTAARVGGGWMFQAMAGILILANLGSGLTGQVAAARLLFGMGRDNVLPRKVFAHLDARRNTPTFNLWILGIFAVAGAMVLTYETSAEILNFGAFVAFMGVNLAVIKHFCFTPQPGRKPSWALDGVLPALGFLICLIIWLSLPKPAKIFGGIWLLAGLVYDALQTKGFRKTPLMVDFSQS